MVSDAPETWFELSRSERDHLVAAAQLDDPNGTDIQARVAELRSYTSRPTNTTTYGALERLIDWGLLDGETTAPRAPTHYSVTDAGWVLFDTAAEAFPDGDGDG